MKRISLRSLKLVGLGRFSLALLAFLTAFGPAPVEARAFVRVGIRRSVLRLSSLSRLCGLSLLLSALPLLLLCTAARRLRATAGCLCTAAGRLSATVGLGLCALRDPARLCRASPAVTRTEP